MGVGSGVDVDEDGVLLTVVKVVGQVQTDFGYVSESEKWKFCRKAFRGRKVFSSELPSVVNVDVQVRDLGQVLVTESSAQELVGD